MYRVVTQLSPTRYWLICQGCGRRWALDPAARLLPQTRAVFADHDPCPDAAPRPS